MLILTECRMCGSRYCGYTCRFFPGEKSRLDLAERMERLKKEMEEILKGETKCFPKI